MYMYSPKLTYIYRYIPLINCYLPTTGSGDLAKCTLIIYSTWLVSYVQESHHIVKLVLYACVHLHVIIDSIMNIA